MNMVMAGMETGRLRRSWAEGQSMSMTAGTVWKWSDIWTDGRSLVMIWQENVREGWILW